MQLTLSLDSGSENRSGAAFAKNFMHAMVWVDWDCIHRLIRDIKLATGITFSFIMSLRVFRRPSQPPPSVPGHPVVEERSPEHTNESVVYRALIHYLAVATLDQRPFGSGKWFELKKAMATTLHDLGD